MKAKCATCSKEVSEFADSCPACGAPFRKEGPSLLGVVLCVVSWLCALAAFAGAKSDIQIIVALVLGAIGVAWLAALRKRHVIKGSALPLALALSAFVTGPACAGGGDSAPIPDGSIDLVLTADIAPEAPAGDAKPDIDDPSCPQEPPCALPLTVDFSAPSLICPGRQCAGSCGGFESQCVLPSGIYCPAIGADGVYDSDCAEGETPVSCQTWANNTCVVPL